jgi:transcription termination/antitermination protein NusA
VASIYQSIEILSKEKGIDPQIVIDAVKDAMLVAARKHFRTTEDLVAAFNDATGALEIYGVKKVVESVQDPVKEISLDDAQKMDPSAQLESEVRFPKPTDALGRISAQTAKQVILQKVREAERETIFSEYSGRVGELVNCSVKRIEGQDLIVDLGKTEARLLKKEQSKLENFSVGDRARCVIRSVEKAGKNAGVIVSRAAPERVMRLFEQEVPEIYDNTVVIKGCAREAGERTKIAVMSRDKDVDPVGACVGMKGMRVQSIIRELRGEKIDIIEFSEEITTFAEKALQPAKVSRVSITDLTEKQLEVIVDDTQLSLAIGKKGQNVRLAAKLLGWKIDIKSEEEKRQEVEQQMQGFGAASVTPIEQVSELGEGIIQKLVTAGITTVEALADMTPEQLEEVPGIGEKTLEKISAAVRHYFGQYEPGEERPAPAASDVSSDVSKEKAAEEASLAAEEASLKEEEDALRLDLTQEGEEPPSEDGSGRIIDEVAEEQIEEVTDSGPSIEYEGAEPVAPGQQDTSRRLQEHAVLDADIAEPGELREEDDLNPEGGE